MPIVSSSKKTNIIPVKVVDYSDWQMHSVFSCKKKSITANNFPQITQTNFIFQSKPMPKQTRGIHQLYIASYQFGMPVGNIITTRTWKRWSKACAQSLANKGRPFTPGYPEVQFASPRGLKNHSGLSSSKTDTQEREVWYGWGHSIPGSFLG